jgi:hypothetical protein
MWRRWMNKSLIAICVLLSLGALTFQNCAQNKYAAHVIASEDSPSQLEIPADDPVVTEPLPYAEKAQVNKMVANRVLMTNFFISIFGPQLKNLASLYMGYQASDFGSGFSIYDSIFTSDCSKNRNPYSPCSGVVIDFQTPPNVGLNIRREAWRLRTCHRAVAINAALLFALKKIDSHATLTSLPDINEANLDKAYQLFFRAKPLPSNELIDSLTIVSQKESDKLKKWQEVILTLCISPHWQVL